MAPFPDESITCAISQKVDAIALDAGLDGFGSVSSGLRQLSRLMKARQELSVTLIIASCGTCGTSSMVDWTRDMCLEVTQENLKFKLALIYSEQDKEYLKKRLHKRRMMNDPRRNKNQYNICEEILT